METTVAAGAKKTWTSDTDICPCSRAADECLQKTGWIELIIPVHNYVFIHNNHWQHLVGFMGFIKVSLFVHPIDLIESTCYGNYIYVGSNNSQSNGFNFYTSRIRIILKLSFILKLNEAISSILWMQFSLGCALVGWFYVGKISPFFETTHSLSLSHSLEIKLKNLLAFCNGIPDLGKHQVYLMKTRYVVKVG